MTVVSFVETLSADGRRRLRAWECLPRHGLCPNLGRSPQQCGSGKTETFRPVQQMLDRRGMQSRSAARRAFAHGFELGGDSLERAIKGRCFDAGNQPDQAVVALLDRARSEILEHLRYKHVSFPSVVLNHVIFQIRLQCVAHRGDKVGLHNLRPTAYPTCCKPLKATNSSKIRPRSILLLAA